MCQIDEKQAPVKCEQCGHLYDADCVKRSEMTSEYYCTEGKHNCWDEMAEYHHQQQIKFGYVLTEFK